MPGACAWPNCTSGGSRPKPGPLKVQSAKRPQLEMIMPRETNRTLRIVVALACLLAAAADAQAMADSPVVGAVESVSVTVSDMERSLRFYHDVLGFEPVGDVEVAGDDYEHLYGVFGARVRIVTLRLGDENLKLEQFLATHGRPIPSDSHSNDGWFQHIAIIVADIDRAYAWLREHQVEQSSTAPQLLPKWNPNAGGIAAYYFR